MPTDGEILLVAVDLGGKTRRLRFDFNAQISFEDETGIDLLRPESAVDFGKSKNIRAFLWACLLHEDPELTVQQVGSWMTLAKVAEITAACHAALILSMPAVSDEAGNATTSTATPNRATRRRNGTTSGR